MGLVVGLLGKWPVKGHWRVKTEKYRLVRIQINMEACRMEIGSMVEKTVPALDTQMVPAMG